MASWFPKAGERMIREAAERYWAADVTWPVLDAREFPHPILPTSIDVDQVEFTVPWAWSPLYVGEVVVWWTYQDSTMRHVTGDDNWYLTGGDLITVTLPAPPDPCRFPAVKYKVVEDPADWLPDTYLRRHPGERAEPGPLLMRNRP